MPADKRSAWACSTWCVLMGASAGVRRRGFARCSLLFLNNCVVSKTGSFQNVRTSDDVENCFGVKISSSVINRLDRNSNTFLPPQGFGL